MSNADHRYEVILYRSPGDDRFIAEVPELPGCAADGATHREALDNVEVIIGEWLDTARALGRPIPEPTGRLNAWLPLDVKVPSAESRKAMREIETGEGLIRSDSAEDLFADLRI